MLFERDSFDDQLFNESLDGFRDPNREAATNQSSSGSRSSPSARRAACGGLERRQDRRDDLDRG